MGLSNYVRGRSNCWEVMKCGREKGGLYAGKLGVCPAAVDESLSGMNGGLNGGRMCWAVAGTFCADHTEGAPAVLRFSCADCEFFKRVNPVPIVSK